MHQFGLPTSAVRSSFIKEILRKEFRERIGFHSRHRSELVYDVSRGSSYVKAVLSSIGISNEHLIYNAAERLREDIKQTKFVQWPPRVEQLEDKENLSPLLLMLLSALRVRKRVDLSPCTLALTSLLMQYAVQGRAHVPNIYMKFNDPFPSTRAFKTLLCSSSNKGRLQNLVCRHLTDLVQSVHAEIIYSVGS